MFVVGVTGGLATGKSTVAVMFGQLGAKIIEADKIVHRHLNRGGLCFAPVLKVFGPDIVTQGAVDRRKLAAVVFKNPKKLSSLVRIVHPVVKREIKRELERERQAGKHQVIVLDVPLLFEAGLDREVDLSMVVKATRPKQLERAVSHLGISRREARQRMSAQMPLKDKIRLADIIIDNSQGKTETKKQVRRIWQRIQIQQKKKD